LFIGGYLLDITNLNQYIDLNFYIGQQSLLSSFLIEGIFYGVVLAFKTCLMIFVFIWIRSSLPRIRYDQLMLYCWTILLPIVIAFIVLIPCIIYSFDIICSNILLF